MKKTKINLLLILIVFTCLFLFAIETKAEEPMPVGTLLYRTSAGNKMYGYNTNIILGKDGVKSGHVAIYAGKGKILEAVNRGVVLNDLNRFINADNGEQFVGAKIPVNFSSIDEDRIESIIKFFESKKFLYDADLAQQKGPNTEEWICSGVAEKIYESLGFPEKRFTKIKQFQYNPNNYFINITPDAYEDNSIHNEELGDHFALNKEYSQINKRKPIKEKGFAVNGLGKLKDGKNYFFFPYTQFLQPNLKSVEVNVADLTSSFDQEKIRGKSLMLATVWQGAKNNTNNFKKEKIADFKKVVKNTTNKVKDSFASLWGKTKNIFKKNKTVIVKEENKGTVLAVSEEETKTKKEIKVDLEKSIPIVGELLEKNTSLPIKKVLVEKTINNKQLQNKTVSEIVRVDYVIDGDTIVLSTGEKVRYIGIDTPELNKDGPEDDECLAWVAKTRNQELLSMGTITLVKDSSVDKDKYGRLLRYVYANDVFINKVLVAEGLAETFFCGKNWENCPFTSDQTRKNIILEANDNARESKRGIFSEICIKKEIEKKIKKIQPIEIEEKNESKIEKKFIDKIRPIHPFNPNSSSDDTELSTEQVVSTDDNTEQSTTTPEISTTTPETSTTTSSTKSPIIISEFATRHLDNTSDEFVEIYNSSSTAIDISGWKLMKKSVTGDIWQSKTSEGLADGSIISALGFFLFGSKEYDYVIQLDYRHTASLSLADSGGHIRIVDEIGNEIDRVGYGNDAIDSETSPIVFDLSLGSAERRAYVTSTSQSMGLGGSHYFFGNAFDSDDNSFDFIIKNNPEPQNSSSLSEPINPSQIIPEEINDLYITASSSGMELVWTAPINGNISSTSYYDIRYEEIGKQDEAIIDWDNTYYKEEYFSILSAGEEQRFVISNLKLDAKYVFAIKIFNGYNWSDISNQITTTTMTTSDPFSGFDDYHQGINAPIWEVEDIVSSFECEYTSDLVTADDIFAQTFIPQKSFLFSTEKLLSSFSFMIKPISADNHSIDAIRICSGEMTTANGTNPQADWDCDNQGQAIISDFSLSQNKFTKNLGSYQWRNFFRGTGNNWENQEDNHFIMIKGRNLSFCHDGVEIDSYPEGEAVSQYNNISDFVFATFFEIFLW